MVREKDISDFKGVESNTTIVKRGRRYVVVTSYNHRHLTTQTAYYFCINSAKRNSAGSSLDSSIRNWHNDRSARALQISPPSPCRKQSRRFPCWRKSLHPFPGTLKGAKMFRESRFLHQSLEAFFCLPNFPSCEAIVFPFPVKVAGRRAENW